MRLIHSVASDSVLAQLAKHAPQRDDFGVLVEVNVAGEASKSGDRARRAAGASSSAARHRSSG